MVHSLRRVRSYCTRGRRENRAYAFYHLYPRSVPLAPPHPTPGTAHIAPWHRTHHTPELYTYRMDYIIAPHPLHPRNVPKSTEPQLQKVSSLLFGGYGRGYDAYSTAMGAELWRGCDGYGTEVPWVRGTVRVYMGYIHPAP